MKKRTAKWDMQKRKNLESLLKEGYKVPVIARMLELSSATVYNEIKRGLSKEEYESGRYIKYTAERVIENEIAKLKGEIENE